MSTTVTQTPAITESTLRREGRHGSHTVLETACPIVHVSSYYPDRVTIILGKNHILRLTLEDAAFLKKALEQYT